MTREDRFTNLLTDWLEDQPERAPDQLLATVLNDLQSAPQRARWRLAARRFRMLGSGPIRYAALAGAAALAVIVAVGLWAGQGPPPGAPGATPTPTPLASPLSGQGYLAAGSYFHEANAIRITLEVPPGWHNIVANEVRKSYIGLGFYQSGLVHVDPCRPEAGFEPTETVEDFATALASMPFAEVTPPTDMTIDGFRGKHLAWTFTTDTPGNLELCGGRGGSWQFASFIHEFQPRTVEPVAGKHQDVWVLDVAGTPLVINAEYYLGFVDRNGLRGPETPSEDRAELEAIIESLQIETTD